MGAAGASETSSAGSLDFSDLTPPDTMSQARRRKARSGFARDMVFQEFGYCGGRALDYDIFVDRKPHERTRRSPNAWRCSAAA